MLTRCQKRYTFENVASVLAVVYVLLGRAVTKYRRGGHRNLTFMRHKFLVLTVKKWLKSVYINGNYRKIKPGYQFFGPPCINISLKMTLGPNGKNGNMFFLCL